MVVAFLVVVGLGVASAREGESDRKSQFLGSFVSLLPS